MRVSCLQWGQCSGKLNNLANEWWAKFTALPPEKLEIAKSIIAMNKFKDEDITCDDEDVKEVLSYYKITRDDAERNR